MYFVLFLEIRQFIFTYIEYHLLVSALTLCICIFISKFTLYHTSYIYIYYDHAHDLALTVVLWIYFALIFTLYTYNIIKNNMCSMYLHYPLYIH